MSDQEREELSEEGSEEEEMSADSGEAEEEAMSADSAAAEEGDDPEVEGDPLSGYKPKPLSGY